MRNEVERSATTVQVTFKDKSDAPSHIAVQLHDGLFEDSELPTTRQTGGAFGATGVCFCIVACVMTQIRDGKNVASTLHYHEVARVLVFCKCESDVVLPAHNETGAVTGDHVWIARTCISLA